jgi:CRISPR-associated protein Cas2
MRRCYLVCYDIRDSKRLRHVHKLMKGYGEPWQYSVFFCILRDIDRVRMQTELEKEMDLKEDQALVLEMDRDEDATRQSVTSIGQPLPKQEGGTVVI